MNAPTFPTNIPGINTGNSFPGSYANYQMQQWASMSQQNGGFFHLMMPYFSNMQNYMPQFPGIQYPPQQPGMTGGLDAQSLASIGGTSVNPQLHYFDVDGDGTQEMGYLVTKSDGTQTFVMDISLPVVPYEQMSPQQQKLHDLIKASEAPNTGYPLKATDISNGAPGVTRTLLEVDFSGSGFGPGGGGTTTEISTETSPQARFGDIGSYSVVTTDMDGDGDIDDTGYKRTLSDGTKAYFMALTQDDARIQQLLAALGKSSIEELAAGDSIELESGKTLKVVSLTNNEGTIEANVQLV